MGSHIDCIIPKDKEYSIEKVKLKLKSVFKKLQPEYLHLKNYGSFSKNLTEDWRIDFTSDKNENPKHITGDGGSFSIDIYENVICICCVERFYNLNPKVSNFANELFKIVSEISNEFRKCDSIIIAKGGFGATCYVLDMAFDGSNFQNIYNKMIELNGSPANELNELSEKIWYSNKQN